MTLEDVPVWMPLILLLVPLIWARFSGREKADQDNIYSETITQIAASSKTLVDTMQEERNYLLSTVQNLRSEITSLQQQIDQMHTSHRKEINELRAQIAKQEPEVAENKRLKGRVEHLEGEQARLEIEVQALRALLQEHGIDPPEHLKPKKTGRRKTDPVVLIPEPEVDGK